MRLYPFCILLLCFVLPTALQAQRVASLDVDSLNIESIYNKADDIVEYVSYEDTAYPVSNLTQNIFTIIFVLIVVYTFFIFFTPLFVQFINIYRKLISNKRSAIGTLYKEQIFDYLVAKDNTTNSLTLPTPLNKRVLLEVLYDLIRYLEGADRERLLAVYTQFELEKQLITRIKRSPFNKGYFLKMLSSFSSSSDSLELIEKMIHHRNSEIRMYAAQAYFALRPEEIYTYFETYSYNLSQWEQINYYHFFVTRHMAVPNFRGLLLNQNDTVVMFAARMIRLFHQKKGNINGFEHLKNHPNILVQIELLRTLAEFGYSDLEIILPDLMLQVDPYIKQHIITYLAKLDGAKTDQLMAYYHRDESIDFRLHVLFSIYNFVQNGTNDILQFSKQSENTQLRQLSVHLINNVL